MTATPKILFQGGANNVLFTDRRYFYPEDQVYEYWKNQSQFLTWVSNLNRKPTPDTLYKIFEDTPTYANQYFYNNGSSVSIGSDGSESNAITVDNITNLTQGATADDSMTGLLVEVWNSTLTTKRGVAFVSSIASSTTLKMKTTKGTAIATVDNDVYRVIGTVRGATSVAGEGYFNELSLAWNSTHYYSLPVEIQGKLYKETKLRGVSNELGRLREKKFKEAKMHVQNILLKSSSTVGTNFTGSDTFTEANLRTITDSDSNSSNVRTTYGYIPILEDYGTEWKGIGSLASSTYENANIFTMPVASLDYTILTQMTEIIFDKRENDVIPAFCGRGFMTDIATKVVDNSKFGFLGKVQLGDNAINGLGFAVRNLYTPHGTIQLIPTKALSHEYNHYALLPNDQAIGIREYEPWMYKTNVKTDNDYNGVKDVIDYDFGLQMNLLATHHMIRLTP